MKRRRVSTTAAKKFDPMHIACPVRAALDVIRGRWKPSLLYEIKDQPKRYSQLQAALPMASAQAITVQLRQLEADGVVCRRVDDDAPGRVEYMLTERGATLSKVMDELEDWGRTHLEIKKPVNGRFKSCEKV
jgi:DNA-binding HxlR family transcriptional regulator